MKIPNLVCHSHGMFSSKYTFFLIFVFSVHFINSQTYPAQVSINSVNWGSYQFPTSVPPYQNSFTDPVTGNNVTRISDEIVFGCDCSNLRHRYAKNQAWNADGTLIMSSGSPSKILDGETFEVLYESYTKALWSNTEPNYTYDAEGNARFVKKNIITNQTILIKQFSGYSSISIGNNEGNLSNDDRYVAVIGTSGSNKTIIVYDILNDQIVSTKPIGTYNIDWVSVSQSGNYVVVSGYADGSGYLQGIKVFDKFMNNEIHLYNGRPHGDMGYDAQGNEVYVAYEGINGYALSYARLDNGQKQGLFPFSGATGDRGLWGGHISTRNLDRPGWAYVSDQGHPTDINRYEATREIFAIKLDDSQTIERFAKHNSNININNGYYHQAHAVPNRDGTKVLFASNWDITSLKNNNYPVMFVVQAPQNTNSNQVVAGDDATICQGETTTLSASDADSYTWTPGNLTGESIDVSPLTNTTYTVTGIHSDGSTSTDSIVITVTPLPIANAGNDVEICQGNSVTLSASGGTSYLWSTGATTQSISVNPNITTAYSVVTTENNCSSEPDEITVTVNPLPTVDAGLDLTINFGESTVLTANGADSYVWNTGETTQSITVSPSVETTYTVTGTTDTCENSDSVTVFLIGSEVVANAGENQTICAGLETTITATGGAAYVWSTGETTASINVSPTNTTTYTVTVFDESGTVSDTDDVIVNVTDNPIAIAGDDLEICQGASVTLTASGGSNYVWNTGATSQSITVSPNTTTTYSVEVIENNCSSIDEVVVTVNALPTTDAGIDVSITEGETTTLTASGADSYVWNTGETTQSIDVSPINTTTYFVTGFSNGCEATDEVTVTVETESVVANAGADVSICEGESTILTASGGATYQWNTGETTSNIEVSPNTTTTYSVTVFNSLGTSSDTDEVQVTVNALPSIDAGIDISITEGETTTLTASGADSYVWNTGETTQSIDVSPLNNTTYSVAGFSNGCEATDEVTVTVETESVVADAGADVSICEGESTILTASGGATYQWSTGETSSSIEVSPNTTTTYSVTVFNSLGTSSDTDEVQVTVNALPSIDAGIDITITEGETTTLTASGADSYVWSTGATTQSIDVSPLNTTTYSVTGFSNGCEATDEVTVTVETESVVANAGADVSICEGESTLLNASGGATYQWSTGETSSSIEVSPNTTTTYSVTVFNSLGTSSDTDEVLVSVNALPNIDAGIDVSIIEGETTTLTASGADSYVWSTGETTQSIDVSPLNTTTYSVTGLSNGCEATDEITVTVETEAVVANAGVDVSICEGESTLLTASGGATYQWSTGETSSSVEVSPNTTTTYSVTVFNSLGTSSDTDEVQVTVNALPNTDAGIDISITEGETTTLTASGADTYVWSTGETTQSIDVSPLNTTTYSVTGFSNGCEATDEITVTVETESVVADAGVDVSICEGESTLLTASGGATYQWSTGETSSSIEVSPNTTTTYSVTVFNSLGTSSDTDEVTVNVNAIPVANAGNDVEVCQGTEVALSASGGSNYLWSTGETSQTIFVSPNTTTTYSVEVIQNNCSSIDNVTVIINNLPNVNAGSDMTITEGEGTVLTATGADTYVWSTGETTQTINVNPLETTLYSVTGFSNGCEATDDVLVTVEPIIFSASAGEDQFICEGTSTILTASEGDAYLWSTGETTQSISVSPYASETYWVTVFEGNEQAQDDVSVFVNLNPNVVIVNGGEVDILEGEFITLSASGANTYEWNNGATQPNIAVSPTTTTTFSVTGYINNCSDEKSITVNVLETVEAYAGEDLTICDNETVTLTAIGGEGYLWNTGEETQSINVTPGTDTEYSVLVYNELSSDEATVMVYVNDCSSVEIPQAEEEFGFLVYQDASADVIKVQISGMDRIDVDQLVIYDITGKIVYREQIRTDENTQSLDKEINASPFSRGIYIVRLVYDDTEILKKIPIR